MNGEYKCNVEVVVPGRLPGLSIDPLPLPLAPTTIAVQEYKRTYCLVDGTGFKPPPPDTQRTQRPAFRHPQDPWYLKWNSEEQRECALTEAKDRELAEHRQGTRPDKRPRLKTQAQKI
jgi:hypothetical protein